MVLIQSIPRSRHSVIISSGRNCVWSLEGLETVERALAGGGFGGYLPRSMDIKALYAPRRRAMQGFGHMGFPSYFVYIAGRSGVLWWLHVDRGIVYARREILLLVGEMAVALVKVHGLNYESDESGRLPVSIWRWLWDRSRWPPFGAGLISLDQAVFGGRRKRSGAKIEK